MNKLISLFPQQIYEALKIGQSFAFNRPDVKWENVVVSGLGGSGIGGTIIHDYSSSSLPVPFIVNKNYDLPTFVNQHSLVIISSYSGNTEETVSAFNQALQKNAFVVCITSGGKIAEMASANQTPCFHLPSGLPPRACLGYSLPQVLFALYYAGLINNHFIGELSQAADTLVKNEESIQATAKNLSNKIFGKIPVIYASGHLEGVSIRWRQQLNENSKVVGWAGVVPEMNHNELVGWKSKEEKLGVIFLHAASDPSKVKIRMEISKEIIQKCTASVFDICAYGETYFEQAFSLIHIGDWFSWYLSELRQEDAMEVKVIDFLKGELASR